MLAQEVGRTIEHAVPLRHDGDGPAVVQQLADMAEGTLGLAREARHRAGIDAHVLVVGVRRSSRRSRIETLVGRVSIRAFDATQRALTTVEATHRPPRAIPRRFAQGRERDEVSSVEVDRRLSTGRGRVPRGRQELAVGLHQAGRARDDLLR